MSSSSSYLWTCSRCLRAQRLRGSGSKVPRLKATPVIPSSRLFSATARFNDEKPPSLAEDAGDKGVTRPRDEQEQGAMSRRLAEMAEDTMDTGSKSDRKLMQDAGFSDELKQQLQDRIAQTSFEAQNQRAISQATMPVRLDASGGNEPIRLTIRCRVQPAKAHATSLPQPRGRAPNPYTMALCECSTTVTRDSVHRVGDPRFQSRIFDPRPRRCFPRETG